MGEGIKSKVTVKDTGWKALQDRMKKLAKAGPFVKIGILSDGSHQGSDIGLVEIGAIHEFGSPSAGIPERSFIRSTFDREHDQLEKLTEKLATKVMNGEMSAEQALGLLGAWGAGQVQRTIVERLTTGPEPQELKPATIARKGSSTPLVDHGLLKAAITWKVEGGGVGAASGGEAPAASEGGEE